MKKKIIFAGGIILAICLCVFGAMKIIVFRPDSVVLPAISKSIANGMIKEDECYIVQVADSEEFDLAGWYYMNGKEKEPIRLIGRRPINELSYIFMEPDRNRFVVKGYVHDQLTIHHNILVFFVEEWYLVAPIERSYGQNDYHPGKRFFYPSNYLDAYDVEQGDYNPTYTYDLTWNSSWEYYLRQDGYYKIRSRWNGSELEWFLVYDERDPEQAESSEVRYFEDGHVEKRVYIEGNSPEYLLGPKVLHNGYDDERCSDFFMVKGDLQSNPAGIERLEIYKWWINTPFTVENDYGYMAIHRWGFNQEDAEAGIYKNYR